MAGSQTLEEFRQTIEGFLRKSFDDVHVDRMGDFFVRSSDVTTWIQVRSLAEDQTAVLIWSPSNIGMIVESELTRFLATEGNNLHFGQFELHRAPTSRLHVSHALLGEFLSREELALAVEEVADASARYGRIVKERFGGRLAREHEIIAGQPIPILEEIAEVVERTGQWPPPEPEPESVPSTAPPPARANKTTQAVFGLAGFAAGVLAAVLSYRATASWFVVAFAFLGATYLIGRAASDLVTDPDKARRALFFLVSPAVAVPVLLLAHELWGRWWLATLLAFAGWFTGGGVAQLLFPRIARDELVDTTGRTRRSLGLDR